MADARSWRGAGIAIGIGTGIVAAMVFLLPAGLRFPIASWTVVVTVVVAVLFLPVRRWWSWPAEDRIASVRAVGAAIPQAAAIAVTAMVSATALVLLLHVPDAGLIRHAWRVLGDGGAMLLIVAGGVALTYALRPVTPLAASLWAERRGLAEEVLPHARRELRRTRTLRTIPAVLGAAIGIAPGSAYNLALDIQGTPPSAAALDMLTITNTWPYDPLTLALVGYLLGAVLAELTRRAPARQPGHRAHLETRTPADYLVPAARWLPRALTAATLGAMTGATLAGSDGAWWPVALALLLLGVAEVVQRWVIRRAQRVDPGAPLQVDDVMRSSAAHGIAGGVSALLLVTAGGAFNELVTTLWASEEGVIGGVVGAITTIVAIALIAAVWGVWLGFGSAHRGQTPARDSERIQ